MNDQATHTVSIENRMMLIKAFPCFANLSAQACQELAGLMQEVHVTAHQQIVIENALVDSIDIIVSGHAEVSRETMHRKRKVQVPVASLGAGEGIGLNDTGFYSKTGKRTATVTAATDMLLLKLDLDDLYLFLKNHNLETAMVAASMQMLRMRFIKQSLPFAKISHERLRWLADHVEEIKVPAQTVIFKQGEKGDRCYLIYKGQVQIISEAENGQEQQLAQLKPPVLFGEATLITHTSRNATARAVVDSELLMLRNEYLSELLESEDCVASMFMTLMVDRSRPLQNPQITVHHRTAADGQEITILKNPETHSYFKLSNEGFFVWNQLDGKHTLQDITLKLAEACNLFAPDVVVALISKLTRSGFVFNVEITDVTLSKQPFWVRAMVKMQRLMNKRIAFGDADAWVSRIYEKYIRYLFSRGGQIFLAMLAVVGLFAFIASTSSVLGFFAKEHAGMWLLLTLIPLSLGELILHEFGHAFAVKAFGREVHYIGIGWLITGPVAFTDTSDMWLAERRPRMLVNLVGVFVDVVVAGSAALCIFIFSNHYIQGMLWLFALYTYIGGFRMLSPLQEMDGYYVLMDWVEKNRLRQAAVLWLVKKFPKSLRHPSLFRENKPEIIYWIACLIYLAFVTALTLIVQKFIFTVLGFKPSNPYLSLILPFLVVLASSLGIIADIRSQAEE